MTAYRGGPIDADFQRLLALLPIQVDERGTRFVAEGWDNRVYLLGDDVLLRVSKNDSAARQLVREANVLKRIAPILPLPVPLPEFIQTPTVDVTLAAMAYRKIPGDSLHAHEVDADAVTSLAPVLAQFLDALHGIPVETVAGFGVANYTPDEWLARHVELVDDTREMVRERLDRECRDRFERWWDDYRRDPVAVDFTPCFIHGDLSGEHVLVDRDARRVTGVIDFGDAMIADPALDLAGLPDALAREVLRRMRLAPYADYVWRRRDAYRRIAPLHAVQVGSERQDFGLLVEGIDGLKRRFSL